MATRRKKALQQKKAAIKRFQQAAVRVGWADCRWSARVLTFKAFIENDLINYSTNLNYVRSCLYLLYKRFYLSVQEQYAGKLDMMRRFVGSGITHRHYMPETFDPPPGSDLSLIVKKSNYLHETDLVFLDRES